MLYDMIEPRKGVPPGKIYIPQPPIYDCSIIVVELDVQSKSIGVFRFHCAHQFKTMGEFHSYLLRPKNYGIAVNLGYRPDRMPPIEKIDVYMVGQLHLTFTDRDHTMQYEFHDVDSLLAYLVDQPALAAAIHYHPKMPGSWGGNFIWYGKNQFDMPYNDEPLPTEITPVWQTGNAEDCHAQKTITFMNHITLPALTALKQKEIILLVSHELKSRKIFGGLRDLGLDNDEYHADLIEVILTAIGVPPEIRDELYEYCYGLFEKHSNIVAKEGGELLDEAQRAFYKLVQYAQEHINKRESPNI
jgi:hypothetical protein